VPRARLLLSKARSGSGAQYPRVWMKSAIVERELGNTKEVGSVYGVPCRHYSVSLCGCMCVCECVYVWMKSVIVERELGNTKEVGSVYGVPCRHYSVCVCVDTCVCVCSCVTNFINANPPVVYTLTNNS